MAIENRLTHSSASMMWSKGIMRFYHNELALNVPESVYFPREDSLLLAGVLEKEKLQSKKVLEVGCGSGFLSIVMASGKAIVTAVDASKDAVEATKLNAKKNDVSLACFASNLFSAVTSKFDLIVFNPPYLPDDSDDKTYSGGKSGREVIEKFIKQAKNHLNKNGKILLLISSLTGEQDVLSLFHTCSFKTKIAAREKIPWEELLVIEAIV
ncbi:MAG: methyltransferase [Candidatus Aenigmarchaeota archaeon]|nr:methyltransferase [Candidatus Aenigmarchaeota archaeon]